MVDAQADDGTTYGDLAAKLAADYGLPPDDWQQLVLDDWLTDDGRWMHSRCGLSCPRQNGKNAILEMRELFGMIGRGERVLHTAHQVKTAQKHFRRLKHFFGSKLADPKADYPELNALVTEIRNVNGQEAIYLANGGSVEVAARSQGRSGRGFTVDVIVYDEAQDMSDDDLEALQSTTSAAPLGNPQAIFAGTPPGPKAIGEVFARIRADALSDEPDRICWHEWSAKPGRDGWLDDQAVWAAANPALSTGRLQLDVIEGERKMFSEGGFMRERLGMWLDGSRTQRVIPDDVWRALVDDGPPDGTVPSALAVDASHDRLLAIAACWTNEAGVHVRLVGLGYVTDTLGAVQWLTENAKPKRIPVVIDSMSPAASMIGALKTARVKVIQTNATDMGKACGLFFDDTMSGRLTHQGQLQLDESLAGARKRRIGDAGGWGWDRKDPAINIAPLVAVTLARYGDSISQRRVTAPGSQPTTIRRKVVVS